jgi:hypothetical protein
VNSTDQPLAVLDLDFEVTLATAETADDYGTLLAEWRDEDHRLRAATMKVLAGACWCLTELPRAPDAFAEARSIYQSLGRSFALVTAICAGEVNLPDIELLGSPTVDDLAFHALSVAWLLASDAADRLESDAILEQLAEDGRRSGLYLTGQLDIPYYHYLRLAQAVRAAARGEDAMRALARPLPRILERATEPLRLAMSDRFHWRMIQTSVMPVEPELLAIGRIAHRALGDWDDEMLELLGIDDGLERLPLVLARALDPPDARPDRRHPAPIPSTPSPDVDRRGVE